MRLTRSRAAWHTPAFLSQQSVFVAEWRGGEPCPLNNRWEALGAVSRCRRLYNSHRTSLLRTDVHNGLKVHQELCAHTSNRKSREASSRLFRQTQSFKWTLSWTGLFINISNQTFEPCVPLLHHRPQTKLINSTSDTHQNQRRDSMSASQNVIQWCFMPRGLALILLPGWEVCSTIRKLKVYLIWAEALIALEDQWGHQQWLVLISWPFTGGPSCSSLSLHQVN